MHRWRTCQTRHRVVAPSIRPSIHLFDVCPAFTRGDVRSSGCGCGFGGGGGGAGGGDGGGGASGGGGGDITGLISGTMEDARGDRQLIRATSAVPSSRSVVERTEPRSLCTGTGSLTTSTKKQLVVAWRRADVLGYNGRNDGRTDGMMDRRTDGRTDGRCDGRTDGRTNERTDGRTDGRSVGRSVGRTDGRTDGWTDERTDGRTNGQPNGRMNRRTDGWTV